VYIIQKRRAVFCLSEHILEVWRAMGRVETMRSRAWKTSSTNMSISCGSNSYSQGPRVSDSRHCARIRRCPQREVGASHRCQSRGESLPLATEGLQVVFTDNDVCNGELRHCSLNSSTFNICIHQGSPTFLKLRATSCVPINAKGY